MQFYGAAARSLIHERDIAAVAHPLATIGEAIGRPLVTGALARTFRSWATDHAGDFR